MDKNRLLSRTQSRIVSQVTDVWSAYRKPLALRFITPGIVPTLKVLELSGAEILNTVCGPTGVLHRMVSPTGAYYYLPKLAWDAMDEMEQEGVKLEMKPQGCPPKRKQPLVPQPRFSSLPRPTNVADFIEDIEPLPKNQPGD